MPKKTNTLAATAIGSALIVVVSCAPIRENLVELCPTKPNGAGISGGVDPSDPR